VSSPIFIDTGAWFAMCVPWDANHNLAMQFLTKETRPLFTTDYVINETLTLLKTRGEMARALALGHQFFRGNLATVHFLTKDEIEESWRTFERFTDKDWSFTDCSSKYLMEKLGLATAFAFDHHFRQFGSVTVVP
jgi:predicted nucleic acid-binding protein